MSDTIKYDFWLAFAPNSKMPRSTAKPPALAVNERAMRVTAILPKSLFQRPQITATIRVDENSVRTPHIDVEVMEAALEAVTGGTVILEIASPDEGAALSQEIQQ